MGIVITIIVGVAVAALLHLPDSPDGFELSKRMVWGALSVAIAAFGFLPKTTRKGVAASSAVAAALIGYMAARTALAGTPFWRWAEPLLAWTMPLCLVLSASLVDWREEDRKLVARGVVAIGVAEAVLMVSQRFGLDPLFSDITGNFEYAPERMVGTIGYQNQAAELLGVALFCVPVCGIRQKSIRVLAALTILSALFLASSRGVLAAVAIVATAMGLHRAHFSKSGIVKITAAAAIFFLFVLAVPETRGRMGDLLRPGKSVAVQSRMISGRVAVAMFGDEPFFGHGAGAYAYSYIDRLGAVLPATKDHGLLKSIVWAREAHNDPLQFLCEFGIVGLVLLLFLVLSVGKGNHFALSAFFLTVCSLFSFSWQTSMAAPLAGLLLGMGTCGREYCNGMARRSIAVFAAACSIVAFAVALALNWSNFDIEEAYWAEASGEAAPFLHGRMRFEAAKEAMQCGNADIAYKLAKEAEDEYLSPDLISLLAEINQTSGRAREALEYWGRLEKAGIMYEDALRCESKAYEALGLPRDAVRKDALRFDMFGNKFTDDDLYRLCVLHLVTGDGVTAEYVSRHFWERCKGRQLEEKWTPEWSNLRGGALLAIGRPKDAKPFFEDALRRKPELKSARKNLERCK